MSTYQQRPVSNGNAVEQALIRRWWRESFRASGLLVWEYCLESRFYADALVFLDREPQGSEERGRKVAVRFPLEGARIVLCEAKADDLSPTLIGQAIVYRAAAVSRGARVEATHVFANRASEFMLRVAHDNGLTPVIGGLSSETPCASK